MSFFSESASQCQFATAAIIYLNMSSHIIPFCIHYYNLSLRNPKEKARDGGGYFYSVGLVEWEQGWQPRMTAATGLDATLGPQQGDAPRLVAKGALLSREKEEDGNIIYRPRSEFDRGSRPFRFLDNVEIILPRVEVLRGALLRKVIRVEATRLVEMFDALSAEDGLNLCVLCNTGGMGKRPVRVCPTCLLAFHSECSERGALGTSLQFQQFKDSVAPAAKEPLASEFAHAPLCSLCSRWWPTP